jgi:hypothetical protein
MIKKDYGQTSFYSHIYDVVIPKVDCTPVFGQNMLE